MQCGAVMCPSNGNLIELATVKGASKRLRHPRSLTVADIGTTMNTYGDVVTDELIQASGKVAVLALNGRETAGLARN